MGVNIKRHGLGKWLIDVRVKVKGKEFRKREVFEGLKELAEERYLKLRRELRKDETFDGSLKVRTFGELLDLYRQYKPSSGANMLFVFDRLKRDLGAYPLKSKGTNLDQYFLLLKNEKTQRTGNQISPSTYNRILVYARAIFNFGIKYEVIERNPLSRVEKLKEVPRDRVLSDDERKKLFETLAASRRMKYFLPAIQFSIQVPIRRSELVNLRKDSLDLVNNVIRLRNGTTKNGQGTFIPIPPDMVTYFRTIPAKSEFLFFRKVGETYHQIGEFKNGWDTVLTDAGIVDFHFHDLRHMAATDLIDNGTPERTVRAIANWKTDMLNRYYHLSDKRILASVVFADKNGHTPKSGHLVDTLSQKTTENSRNQAAIAVSG